MTRAATPPRRLTAERVKQAIPPAEFYRVELPSMPTPKRASGWTDGGLCPFHDDRKPGSFRANLDTGAFTCFSCGTRGADVIAFVQMRYAMTFAEALRALAEQWEVRP